MRFAFSDDQLLFRDAVRAFLSKECGPDVVRAAWDRPQPHSADLWKALAQLGVVGLTVPESFGGLGLNELDLVLLLEESGRVALPEPVLETTGVAAPLLAESGVADAQQRWLPRIAAGDALVAVALDGGDLVLDADAADALIVADGDRVALVERAALELTPQESIDGARSLCDVRWDRDDEVVLAENAVANTMRACAFDRGALGAAAQLVGLADRLLDVTVEYVRQREQFGVPVGSFQAVKHHLADALLDVEFAKPLVYHAAYSCAMGLETKPRDVSMAKCAASDAASLVVRKTLQCHGAIAYTVEYDLHMWMKRVWALSSSWGNARWHRRRVGMSVLGPSPAD